MTTMLQIIPHDGIGGVEESARFLARTLSAEDYRLAIMAGSALEESPSVIASPHRSALSPLAWLDAVRTIRRVRPYMLIFSLWKTVPAMVLALLAGPRAKFVYTLNSQEAAHWLERIATAVALRIADEVWADSEKTLHNRAPRHPGGRVVHPYLPLRADGQSERDDRSFIVWARLDRAKGLDRALTLLAELAKLGVTARYRIIGPDCGEGSALMTQVRDLCLVDQVVFSGPLPRSALPDAARHARFFLMPSRLEGMAVAACEAMQLGLIPIVTPVGDMARYVEDGKNGILVNPDDLTATARRIAQIIQQPDALERMSAKARDTWAMTSDYADNIREAAANLLGSTGKAVHTRRQS